MKNKLSIILFGISFLIAVLGEAYLLNAQRQDLLSITGIGIVVILTGYLWFDSLWEHISHRYRRTMHLWEEARLQEAERLDKVLSEMLNIQKATYSALKKNINKTEEDLNRIIALLKKIEEGQKKALNISVDYGRKQAGEIIKAIKEQCEGYNYEEQLKKIISILDSYMIKTDITDASENEIEDLK